MENIKGVDDWKMKIISYWLSSIDKHTDRQGRQTDRQTDTHTHTHTYTHTMCGLKTSIEIACYIMN